MTISDRAAILRYHTRNKQRGDIFGQDGYEAALQAEQDAWDDLPEWVKKEIARPY